MRARLRKPKHSNAGAATKGKPAARLDHQFVILTALRDRDASGPETALSDAAITFFGVPSLEVLAYRVYSQPLTKHEIAAFAIETQHLQ